MLMLINSDDEDDDNHDNHDGEKNDHYEDEDYEGSRKGALGYY